MLRAFRNDVYYLERARERVTIRSFEIPGYAPPAESLVYTPMGRVILKEGQSVRYRYYENDEERYQLGVVVKHLGTFSKTGHPHYEISFDAPVQHALFSSDAS